MDYVVETKGLTKKFGKETVVNQLDMKIRKGEVYGFLGPNGAGKTTTSGKLANLFVKNGSLYLRGDNKKGTIYSVYEFLEKYIGVKYFNDDRIVVPQKKVIS